MPPGGRAGSAGAAVLIMARWYARRPMEPTSATALARSRDRASAALRRPANWIQLAKFGVVGATGYAINLAVFALLWRHFGVHYLLAATISFLVAVTSNYTWNRLCTFRGQRGDSRPGGTRGGHADAAGVRLEGPRHRDAVRAAAAAPEHLGLRGQGDLPRESEGPRLVEALPAEDAAVRDDLQLEVP